MSRRATRILIHAEVWGSLVPVWWTRRTLTAICGPVSTSVPILVRYCGSKIKARCAAAWLQRNGFRVRVRKHSFPKRTSS